MLFLLKPYIFCFFFVKVNNGLRNHFKSTTSQTNYLPNLILLINYAYNEIKPGHTFTNQTLRVNVKVIQNPFSNCTLSMP